MNHYFSHDSNARNNEKIIALRMKHSWEGYGLYWVLLEKLIEAVNYRLSTNYELIAFDLRTDVAVIKSIINDFNLFVVNPDYFYSESLCRRMKIKLQKSEQARQAALARWGKTNVPEKKALKPKTTKPDNSDFVPPTLAQAKSYCLRRNNRVDAAKFINFYKAKGWMIGKNEMKDWQAALRTWEKEDNNKDIQHDLSDTRIHPALQQ